MATVRLVHNSTRPLPDGHYPSINIPDPHKPGERFIAEPMEGDEEKPEEKDRLFFEVPEFVAKKILDGNTHIFQLWEPEKIRFQQTEGQGATRTMVLESVKHKAVAIAEAKVDGHVDLRRDLEEILASSDPVDPIARAARATRKR
jgi:hypothetical protein